MNRLVRRFALRDLPLVAGFRRCLRADFLILAGLAIGTLVTVEIAGPASARDVSEVAKLDAQRAELARIGGLVAVLAATDDPAEANRLRIEIGSAAEAARSRQFELRLSTDYPVSTDLPEEFAQWLEGVDEVVEALTESDGAAGHSVADVVLGLERLDQVYETAVEQRIDVALADTAALQRRGRWVAALALTAAVLRLFVLGRPLLRQLEADTEGHRRTLSEGRDAQMRSIVSSRLAEGMEAIDDEAGVRVVVERTLARLMPTHPAELLLADSSKARLAVHSQNPLLPTPGCDVLSPWSCPAVRRGRTQLFEDSDSLRSCPHLAGRSGPACSAVCVPVAFTDDSMGVLHLTGELGWRANDFEVFALESLAGQSAVRLRAIRSFERAEIQASTDVLTGLPNRRAVEDQAGRFVNSGPGGSIAIADLDHFKDLNDRYGHEAGDRALRVFAEVLRGALRDDGIVGRWGGEEFLIALPGVSARESTAILDRIRTGLVEACERSAGPSFTVSIGVVDTNAGSGLAELARLADECLYVAKARGRDQIVEGPIAAELSSVEGSGART